MILGDILRATGSILRPAAKAVIKGGMVLYRDSGLGAIVSEAAADSGTADRRSQRASGTPRGRTTPQRRRGTAASPDSKSRAARPAAGAGKERQRTEATDAAPAKAETGPKSSRARRRRRIGETATRRTRRPRQAKATKTPPGSAE